jgi:hypothetical protein
MNSGMNTLAGGFPHSEISGSMLVCQLPGAFRRLPRLSSPVVAKASTACAWSLDPLTPNPGAARGPHASLLPSRARHRRLGPAASARRDLPIPPSLHRTFHIVKEQPHFSTTFGSTTPTVGARLRFDPRRLATARGPGRARRSGFRSVRPPSTGFGFWWSQAGSNRRPPACKAGALPAELWPRRLVGLGGLEPPTSPLSGVRSNRLSYRPALGFRLLGRGFAPRALGKGGDPAAGSPTATLLRLHPSH